LEIYTNKKCVQFYTANHLDGSLGRNNKEYTAFNGLCLETQSFPNAVNHPNFPSVILNPGEEYDYFTSYVFSIF
jgi:aldose 1-epimerase